jgi:hypothetical protein
MRYRDALLIALLMLLSAGPLFAQAEKAAPPPAAPDTRAADVVATLNKSTFTARKAIPASENIFIEDGKVIESLFNMARQENGVALPAGRTAAVSKVVLMDKALQVFFANDKFALMILTKDHKSVDDMTADQLVELAKQAMVTLFSTKEGTTPVT